MNSVTSASIFLSVLLQAVLKRRWRLSGRSILNRRVGSPCSALTGSALPTFGEIWVCVSCAAPPRSKAVMTSGANGLGFGACANVLLIENVQKFAGEVLDINDGGTTTRPFKDCLAHREGFGIGNALFNLRLKNRNTGIGGHDARIASQDRRACFAENHKPPFEGWLEFLRLFLVGAQLSPTTRL